MFFLVSLSNILTPFISVKHAYMYFNVLYLQFKWSEQLR